MILLDGKKTAQEIIDNVKLSLQNHKTKPAIAVILANDEHASRIYVKSKQKRCEELSINSHLYEFAKNSKTSDIIELIEKLNNDKSINGILVQLPLFKHLDVQKIIEKISPIKDVDAFSSYNVSRLWTGLKPYSFPCTPYGILLLAKKYGIDFKSKNVVITGRSNIVGKPMIGLLLRENATVISANSYTKNLKELTKNADIIISATGKPNLITSDMVKEGVIVFDVGIVRNSQGKIQGDVDFNSLKSKASYITPVPGGVGPMTVACLIQNLYNLFVEQNEVLVL